MAEKVKRTLNTLADEFEAFMRGEEVDVGKRMEGKGVGKGGEVKHISYQYFCPTSVVITDSDVPEIPGYLFIFNEFAKPPRSSCSPEQQASSLNAIRKFANSRGNIPINPPWRKVTGVNVYNIPA